MRGEFSGVSGMIGGAVLLSMVFAVALGFNFLQLRDSFTWVEHTNEVLHQIDGAARNLVKAESGERGYLLTGDRSYFESYKQSRAAAAKALDAIERLAGDNRDQERRLAELRPMIEARLAEYEQAIAAGPPQLNVALAVLTSARSTGLTARIEAALGEMRGAELSLLALRQNRVDRISMLVAGFAIASSTLAVILAAFGALLLQRHRDERTLREVQSELLRVSRLSTMGEMSAALAHELNQPLTAMTNYLYAGRRLAEQLPDESSGGLRELIGKAIDQGLRAGRTIRRLREFVSRSDSERRIEKLQKVVEETITLALISARDPSIPVTIAIDPAADTVLIDKIQIQQALLNLLRNAIEATQNAVRREIVISSAPAENGMVRISVADSGQGMPAETMATLFQPFITTKSGGMGIGLSISRTIVAAHGGEITAEANPGGGTVFRFTVPGAAPESARLSG